ncbi:hypothetical protein AVEN_64475-1 [Araneus ventricosus]|uniref:Uncharacterized protein n=1 Tax=Araneus ventricosus TaxID=182803 RepID=A0A4Y2QXV4_ARAVE|nr:hypothetical protein AVEN_64475-1 [Araneus ventricosus]
MAKLKMRHLMQTFDPKEGDINLYLVLFERQARRVENNADLRTRTSKLLKDQEEVVYVKDKDLISVEETEMAATEDIEIENDDVFSFPPKEEFEGLSLLKIDSKDFITAQYGCKELQALAKKKLEKTDARNEFEILPNGLLVKMKTNKVSVYKRLLLVTKELRKRLKALCYEGALSHFGVTKTKDILAKYFFWSNCYKENVKSMSEVVTTVKMWENPMLK